MKVTSILSTLSLALLMALAACAPSNGYYDANGNWVALPDTPASARRSHAPNPTSGVVVHEDYPDRRVVKTVTTTYTYDRPGYYDYNGNYVADNAGFVPSDMYPPRGMCRIWFPGRPYDLQPSIETCEGIRSRVPTGAYVIYGG